MKKFNSVSLVVVAILLSTTLAFAGNQTVGVGGNNNNNENNVTGGAASSSSTNTNSNSQNQGQLQGQIQGQSADNNGNSQGTNVDASNHNKGYFSNLNAASANEGTSLGAVSSPFGGLNIGGTEDYKKVIERIRAAADLKAAGVMSKEAYCREIKESYLQLRDASQPNRLMNSGPVSRGNNLFNLFGLISGNTSYTNPDNYVIGCEDGSPKVVQPAPTLTPTEAPKVEGNGGVLKGGVQS